MGSFKQVWAVATPGVFVLLWSTGFVGARMGAPYADPFIFLLYRFVILAFLLGAAGFIWRAPWPKSWRQVGHLVVVGLLIHASYLGGVFWAISNGVSAAIVAIIVSIQPLLTAVVARSYLGERVSRRQWTGLVFGFTGVALVIGDDINLVSSSGVGVIVCFVALLGITLGTLYQKRHGSEMDLRTGSAIQFSAAAIAVGGLTLYFEERPIEWTGEFVFALAWLIVVLSIGAISLLYLLIRQDAASKVASLFYLVPPVVAIEAYLVFGETLNFFDITGMIVAMGAVALVLHTQKLEVKKE
jgi:drug/metabolite transporter (DMT)-like permease